MIDTYHPELLYKDSPFLPIIFEQDIDEITKLLSQKNTSLLSAITQQAGHVGHALNVLHESQIKWITKSFHCTSEDILLFYIGFTTPVQLILSANQMDFKNTQTVIQNLTIPTNLKLMQNHNKYKIGLLHDCYFIVANKPDSKLDSVFSLVLSLLRQKPFSQKIYYKAGIDAGVYALQTLYSKYKPTTSI